MSKRSAPKPNLLDVLEEGSPKKRIRKAPPPVIPKTEIKKQPAPKAPIRKRPPPKKPIIAPIEQEVDDVPAPKAPVRKRPPPKKPIIAPVEQEVEPEKKAPIRKRPPPKKPIIAPVEEEVDVPEKKAPPKKSAVAVEEVDVPEKKAPIRKRPPPKKPELLVEGEKAKAVPKKKAVTNRPQLVRLEDDKAVQRKKDEGGRYEGFNLGEPPQWIKYELSQFFLNSRTPSEMIIDQTYIALKKSQTWKTWEELYFSFDRFKRSAIRLKLSYEIQQNKVLAGSKGAKCKSCFKDTVQFQLVQSRSGDEGMSIFGRCTNCGVVGKYY